MKSPRPRVPRTTIAALAVIVAVGAGTAGLRQALGTAGPSTLTIVDPQAPGDAAGTGDVTVGDGSADPTSVPGSRPQSPPSRPPGAGPGSATSSGWPGSGTGAGSGPGNGSGAGLGGGTDTGGGNGTGVGAENGPTADPAGTSTAGAGTGSGSLIWNGKPSGGQSKFAVLDCAKPGSLTIENDLRFGPVWVFDKPAGDDRCETHGIAVNKTEYDFRDNFTYYISWWSKVSSMANNDADFQWQSYGTGITQDDPFEIGAYDGHATVFQRQPGGVGQAVWTSPTTVSAGAWHHYVVGVHTSDTLTGGWIQLWYDGKLQSFDNGTTQYACRTWDVNNDPKWGEYGAQGTSIIDYVYAPKVGTSYGSVAD